MDNLILLDKVTVAYGEAPLFDEIKLQIAAGERVCLIGRNGEGKSTLLKVIEGTVKPDSGQIWRKPNLVIARLLQELPQHYSGTVFDFVAEGLAETGALLSAYKHLADNMTDTPTEKELKSLQEIQHQIDLKNGWEYADKIKEVLERLALPANTPINALSGGWQRRAALAQAFVSQPDLLLLDEPTNHLDIEAIQWLEDQLVDAPFGLLFITHDRALLQRLATRIIELDRGQLTSWPGDYQNFLRRKEERLHAEEKQNVLFDKKLAQEERWVRQGIKARRTRNEGRVRALKALRVERAKRREVGGKAKLTANMAESSGRIVIKATHITHRFNEKPLIDHFSIKIQRGDKIGLIGPNGSGKSTLLNILLGELEPQEGSISHGTKLEVAYFDQLRQQLDMESTAIDNLKLGTDTIHINGKQKHVISYLGDFLFSPQRARMPVKMFSGGECNRLLLARLFSKPSNLLVLDEPTNDLDIETLELLESLLVSYPGTLLLVSHDRAFLDNVVTSTLVFEGNGKIQEYIGGYQEWHQKATPQNVPMKKAEVTPKKPAQENKGLTHEERKALAKLPKRIESLESTHAKIQARMAAPDFYQGDQEHIQQTITELKAVEQKIQDTFEEWESLERKNSP